MLYKKGELSTAIISWRPSDSGGKLTSVSQFITVSLKCLECLGHDLGYIVNISRENVCLLKPVFFCRIKCTMHAISKIHLHMQKDVKAQIFGNKCELIVFSRSASVIVLCLKNKHAFFKLSSS